MGAWKEGEERRMVSAKHGAWLHMHRCTSSSSYEILVRGLLFPEEETEAQKGQSAHGLVTEMGLDQFC